MRAPLTVAALTLPFLLTLAACAHKPPAAPAPVPGPAPAPTGSPGTSSSTATPVPPPPFDPELVRKVEQARAEALELLYSKDPLVKNEAKAFAKFREVAEMGDPVSMDHLGGFYSTGSGGAEKDCGLAIQWFERAAASGYPISLNNLAYVLVSCPDPKFRDAARAEDLLKTLFQTTPALIAALDTYAVTQAELGHRERAARTMDVVIDLADLTNTNPERLDEFRAQRAQFKAPAAKESRAPKTNKKPKAKAPSKTKAI